MINYSISLKHYLVGNGTLLSKGGKRNQFPPKKKNNVKRYAIHHYNLTKLKNTMSHLVFSNCHTAF